MSPEKPRPSEYDPIQTPEAVFEDVMVLCQYFGTESVASDVEPVTRHSFSHPELSSRGIHSLHFYPRRVFSVDEDGVNEWVPSMIEADFIDPEEQINKSIIMYWVGKEVASTELILDSALDTRPILDSLPSRAPSEDAAELIRGVLEAMVTGTTDNPDVGPYMEKIRFSANIDTTPDPADLLAIQESVNAVKSLWAQGKLQSHTND